MVDPESSSILIKEFQPSELLPPALVASAITNVGSAKQKPKRVHQSLTHRTDPSKSRKVLFLPRDENGSGKMPVKLGILTLWSIGRLVYDRETFHNERYIWAVGYKVSRLYNSMIDPLKKTMSMCSVIDDGIAPKVKKKQKSLFTWWPKKKKKKKDANKSKPPSLSPSPVSCRGE